MTGTVCRNCKKDIWADTKVCPRCGIQKPANSPRHGDIIVGIFLALVSAFAALAWWWIDSRPPTSGQEPLVGISLAATAAGVISLIIFLNSSWSVERRGIAGVTLLISAFILFHATNEITYGGAETTAEQARLEAAAAAAEARLAESERALAAGNFAALAEALAAIPRHEKEALGERYTRLQESVDAFQATQNLNEIAADGLADVLGKFERILSEWRALTENRPATPEEQKIFEDAVLALVEEIPEANPEWAQIGYATLGEIAPENPAYVEALASYGAVMPVQALADPAGGMIAGSALLSFPGDPALSLRGSVEDEVSATPAMGSAQTPAPP